MRRLTFRGFLQSYVRALSGEGTLALSRLAELSRTEPRLVEPLLLWAAVTDRAERLDDLLEGRQRMRQELRMLAQLHATGSLEDELAGSRSPLRAEYVKAWNSYTVRRDAVSRDKELRLEARKRVLELESRKNVPRYRMAKDLGLNPGNLHAFLSQSDPTKLSLDRVVDLVEYLEAA
ncbi:MAG: hypothetical protein U1E29_05975 [Coriobacteriia bacterium]|nr:hypothetical protein [Coriobacteriia bacterium]